MNDRRTETVSMVTATMYSESVERYDGEQIDEPPR